MLLHVALFRPFSWLSNILLYVYITSSLFRRWPFLRRVLGGWSCLAQAWCLALHWASPSQVSVVQLLLTNCLTASSPTTTAESNWDCVLLHLVPFAQHFFGICFNITLFIEQRYYVCPTGLPNSTLYFYWDQHWPPPPSKVKTVQVEIPWATFSRQD